MPFPRPSLGSPRLIISLRSCARRGASNQNHVLSQNHVSICIEKKKKKKRREKKNSLIPNLFVKKDKKNEEREREREKKRERREEET